jgi:hypothetical protein
MRIDSKTYLNFILTVIAVLLFVLAAQIPFRFDPASTAHAANSNYGTAVAGDQGGVKDIGITSEQGLSRAVEKIAAANLQIAKAIDGLGGQIGAISKSAGPSSEPASSAPASPAQ